VRKTSDDFFAANSARFDVVWVDGLHTYEQARADVVNAIAALKPGGWVGIHDLLPRNWIEGFVPRLFGDGAWSGDVWKVAFELASSPGIDFKLLHIDRGVGVFRVLNADARLVDRRRELDPASFAYLQQHVRELPIVEWDAAFQWITDAKRKSGDLPVAEGNLHDR
jgi:SAM-dependent methyltransferase